MSLFIFHEFIIFYMFRTNSFLLLKLGKDILIYGASSSLETSIKVKWMVSPVLLSTPSSCCLSYLFDGLYHSPLIMMPCSLLWPFMLFSLFLTFPLFNFIWKAKISSKFRASNWRYLINPILITTTVVTTLRPLSLDWVHYVHQTQWIPFPLFLWFLEKFDNFGESYSGCMGLPFMFENSWEQIRLHLTYKVNSLSVEKVSSCFLRIISYFTFLKREGLWIPFATIGVCISLFMIIFLLCVCLCLSCSLSDTGKETHAKYQPCTPRDTYGPII